MIKRLGRKTQTNPTALYRNYSSPDHSSLSITVFNVEGCEFRCRGAINYSMKALCTFGSVTLILKNSVSSRPKVGTSVASPFCGKGVLVYVKSRTSLAICCS